MHETTAVGILKDVFFMAVVPAICEEFFFRGFIQAGLAGRIQSQKAIFITAAFFAAYHMNPWYLPFYFILGLLFGFVYEKTACLPLSMLAHFVNNVFGVFLYHFLGKTV